MHNHTTTATEPGDIVLVNVERVKTNSLPHSLRHLNADDALENAISMAHALHIFTMCLSDDWRDIEKAKKGLEHFTALLIDKLEIAAGEYEFPFYAIDEKACPALARREDVE